MRMELPSTPTEWRQLVHDLQAAYDGTNVAIAAEAAPVMQAAWAASPGKTSSLLGPLTRVGLVEHRTDAVPGGRGVVHVWLEQAAWRPWPTVRGADLLWTFDGWNVHENRDRTERWVLLSPPLTGNFTEDQGQVDSYDAALEPGLVWLREPSKYGDVRAAWINTAGALDHAQLLLSARRQLELMSLLRAADDTDETFADRPDVIASCAALAWLAAQKEG